MIKNLVLIIILLITLCYANLSKKCLYDRHAACKDERIMGPNPWKMKDGLFHQGKYTKRKKKNIQNTNAKQNQSRKGIEFGLFRKKKNFIFKK